jgi:hypothetical protein
MCGENGTLFSGAEASSPRTAPARPPESSPTDFQWPKIGNLSQLEK